MCFDASADVMVVTKIFVCRCVRRLKPALASSRMSGQLQFIRNTLHKFLGRSRLLAETASWSPVRVVVGDPPPF